MGVKAFRTTTGRGMTWDTRSTRRKRATQTPGKVMLEIFAGMLPYKIR